MGESLSVPVISKAHIIETNFITPGFRKFLITATTGLGLSDFFNAGKPAFQLHVPHHDIQKTEKGAVKAHRQQDKQQKDFRGKSPVQIKKAPDRKGKQNTRIQNNNRNGNRSAGATSNIFQTSGIS